MSWERLNRKTIVDTKFLKVYEDKVRIPNGHVIEDYSVIQKPDFVLIIATDTNGDLISLQEYKYAVNETLNTLPAGHVNKDEDPFDSAKRELLEETGYTSNDWEKLGYFYDYASKDCHKAFFVKASNASKTNDTNHEISESIAVRIIPISQLKEEVKEGKWKVNAALSALVIAGIYS